MHEQDIYYCHEITLEVLEDLQSNLSKTMSASSVNRYFASYGGFFTRCMKKKYMRENPKQYLEPLKAKSKRRAVWKKEEIEKIRPALRGWQVDYFDFLFMTGCRPIEASNLTADSICFRSKTITFSSKKGGDINERTFPLTPDVETILRRNIAKGHSFVFTNFKHNKITKDCFGDAMRVARKSAGLKRAVVAYGLRHTFMTELAENDVNTMKIKQIAGHKRITTTQNYISLEDETMRSTVTDLADFRNKRIS